MKPRSEPLIIELFAGLYHIVNLICRWHGPKSPLSCGYQRSGGIGKGQHVGDLQLGQIL
ncbi:hypothetical protein D3C75_800620 [compost metagenome]